MGPRIAAALGIATILGDEQVQLPQHRLPSYLTILDSQPWSGF